jgi:acyl carrier protein
MSTVEIHSMNVVGRIRRILRDTLQLGERADALTESSALLGSIPELDSMAVVSVITMIEDEFGVTVDDDEISADTFATLGSLAQFVAGKSGS